MKFSILVPVYNVEQYLEQCVESLLNQTYKDEYEIILVDDGSTDSSGKICDEYAEKRPKKVKVIHEENGGHTSARLAAIKAATGEYCLFCDSDDFVENNLLETINNIINDNPDTDMIMYSFCYYEEGKKTARNVSVFEKTEIFEGDAKKKLYELLITTPYLNSLCTKAVKTDILKNDPNDYSVIADKDIAEDAFIVSNFVTTCKKIVSIDNPLYNYRTNRESISRSYDPKKIGRKNTLFVYSQFKKYLPEWGMDTEEYRQKLNARWLGEAMYIFTCYYENVPRHERRIVLNYNWSSLLPPEVCIKTDNPYENKIYRKLFEKITKKNFLYIKFFFLKRKTKKFLRKLLK